MKKNILFVYCRVIDPASGGVERVSSILAAEFTACGNGVFYLCFGDKRDGNASERQFFFPDEKFITSKNLEFFEQFLREHKIAYVIWQDAGCRPRDFAKIIKQNGTKLIVCSHRNPDNWKMDKTRGAFRRWLHGRRVAKRYYDVYKNADKFVTLSPGYFSEFKKYFRGNDEKLVSISNPLTFPPAEIDWSKKKNEILFVGRLDNSSKRVNWLLEIWAKIEKAFPNWILRIVGDGEDRAELEELAGTLNLRERVEFCGFQNPAEFYKSASIFCMTSAYEGLPLVLVEAQAFGCVPVAFDSFAALRDIITDGENGAIVPAFDLDKYAKTLAKLIRERDLRERLARNAQRDVSRFSRENIIARWEQLFEEIENGGTKK